MALLPLAAGPFLFAQTVPADPAGFEQDRHRAEAGEAKAMTALAHRYERGVGCPRDAGEAILWYLRAAALNEPGAMVALGDIYDEGRCVDQNMREAVQWFRRAAALGSGRAMYRLGQMIEQGRGVRGDKEEARLWYEKAVAAGSASAMTAMGDLTRDPGWYRKAMTAGDTRALSKYAATLPADEALEFYRRGAAADDAAAIYQLGRHEESTDPRRAAELYRRAARLGYPPAMSRYAAWMEQSGGLSENAGQAVLWYTKAAEAGDPAGLTWLARQMEEKNAEEAHDLYARAVHAGYVPAMTRLGVLRADCAMMQRAAELGDVEGMFEYASRCRPENSREWYLKAAERNHVEAMARAGETRRAAEAGHRPSIIALAKTDAVWLKRAADVGEPEAMRLYATTLTDPGDAARWFKSAAEAGDVPAMTETGRRFESGIGVAADREAALKWYRLAAKKGDRFAMYRLGTLSSDMSWVRKAAEADLPEAMCRWGESLDDREQALALFRKAADLGYVNGWTRMAAVTGDAALLERAAQFGDAEAKLRLGEIELQRKKRREAYKLFRAAADSGYGPAMIRVGDCHLNGDGTWLSEIDAVNWYRKAALAGDSQGLAKLQSLGKTQ
jgi:TPR repeat protein